MPRPKKDPAATAQPPKKTTKKAPKPSVEKIEQIYVQLGENEWNVADAVEKAKAIFVAEGHRASSIKSLQLYIKPEDGKAYYVINGKMSGSVEL